MWSVDAIAVPFTHTCHIGGEEEEDDIDERSGEDWLTSTYKIIMPFVIEISGWRNKKRMVGPGPALRSIPPPVIGPHNDNDDDVTLMVTT